MLKSYSFERCHQHRVQISMEMDGPLAAKLRTRWAQYSKFDRNVKLQSSIKPAFGRSSGCQRRPQKEKTNPPKGSPCDRAISLL